VPIGQGRRMFLAFGMLDAAYFLLGVVVSTLPIARYSVKLKCLSYVGCSTLVYPEQCNIKMSLLCRMQYSFHVVCTSINVSTYLPSTLTVLYLLNGTVCTNENGNVCTYQYVHVGKGKVCTKKPPHPADELLH
jgi:hypothetical protein